MRAAYVIEIVTPKKFALNGLWFGPKKPKRAIIWIHGLSSSAFSRLAIVDHLIDESTAVITFNNRGSATVSRVSRGEKRFLSGGGAEHFTESVDDIDGAISYAKKAGATEIFLAGHSTGCQKSIYWAHKRKENGVKGIILLAPLSDWTGVATQRNEKKKVTKATREAVSLLKKKLPDAFLSTDAWVHPITAQRFISLYTPDSVEQSIFPYFDESRSARMYRSVTVPILALFAELDEYADRKAEKIADWFTRHNGSRRFDSVIIPKVGHSFRGEEAAVGKVIREWISR